MEAQRLCLLPKATRQSWNQKWQGSGFWSQRFFWGSLRCLALRGEDWASQNSTGGRKAGSWEAGRGGQGPGTMLLRPAVAGAPTQSKVREAALWTHRLPLSQGEDMFCSRPPGSEPSQEAERGGCGAMCCVSLRRWPPLILWYSTLLV